MKQDSSQEEHKPCDEVEIKVDAEGKVRMWKWCATHGVYEEFGIGAEAK